MRSLGIRRPPRVPSRLALLGSDPLPCAGVDSPLGRVPPRSEIAGSLGLSLGLASASWLLVDFGTNAGRFSALII